jgi:hypothetical protein
MAGTHYIPGSIIDARGVGLSSACPSNFSPWFDGTNYVNVPSTILLPAGAITISYPWILPNGTKLIGEGTSQDGSIQTTIQAASGFSGSAMVQFGDSHCPTVCTGISIENLTLNADGLNIGGILNQNAQDLSYVDRVTILDIAGVGLSVAAGAEASGPYSNITYTNSSAGGTCAKLSASGTRGIHGLTCISTSHSTDAINLDSSNNTLEDIRILGFFNGVVIGANDPAQSDVLLNIYGDTARYLSNPVNVILISSANTVSDISIMGVSNQDAGSGDTTINDTVTSTLLIDPSVALYVLGEAGSGGYSRFTTSKNAATWTSGVNAPSITCSSSIIGALYSDTSGGGLYVCTPSSGWQPIPHT